MLTVLAMDVPHSGCVPLSLFTFSLRTLTAGTLDAHRPYGSTAVTSVSRETSWMAREGCSGYSCAGTKSAAIDQMKSRAREVFQNT
jgi:hypothetical protein